MKKKIALIIGIFWAAGLNAKTMVLPLEVDTQNHTSYQWLGKAVSYYLLSGLQLNSLPVLDEEELQLILNRNLIRFPFAITKATAMVLARENQADRLLWGKILYSDKSSSQISIKLLLINIKTGLQENLPVFKGNLKNIYQIQKKLLGDVIKVVAKEKTVIRFPELNMSLSDYEKFIKSLLIVDAGKKLDLLLSINEWAKRSDFLNFELAKIYFDKNDFVNSEVCLNRITEDCLFKDKKDFLLALVNFAIDNLDEALNQFIRLQRQNIYAAETNNNLGVIYLQKNNFQLAEKCLAYALYLKKDPMIFNNLIILLQAMGQKSRALEELNTAQQLFSTDENLLKQFSYFLNASENRELLTLAFGNFVQFASLEEASSAIRPLLMNPLRSGSLPEVSVETNSFYIEARNLFLENDFSGAMQKAEEAMEVNPFLNENHHLLALLYLQKQDYAQAEIYAQSALFLKETPDNFLLQIKIYQAWQDKKKFWKALILALQKFPQNAELLELKGKSN